MRQAGQFLNVEEHHGACPTLSYCFWVLQVPSIIYDDFGHALFLLPENQKLKL